MSKDLKIQLILSAMDKFTAPMGRAVKSVQKIADVLNSSFVLLGTLFYLWIIFGNSKML